MKVCELCAAEVESNRRRYCDRCRDQQRAKTLREAQVRHEATRGPRDRSVKRKTVIPCATCRHGLSVAGAEMGYACAASVARTCSPLGPRRMWVAR